MASYKIDTSADQEAGITAARAAYNANLPEDSADTKATNADYLVFVVASAFESYQNQYKVGSKT